MKKKEIFRSKKNDFLNNILPILRFREDYSYKEYPHFVKIYYKDEVYDYYPGAERLFDLKNKKWQDLKVEKLIEMVSC